ncbi:hypothetical protein SAMN06297164_3534 [Nitrosomonas ureae]|uniref:Uncharacterized protein n=1 Tax=Nitrosomonas ureae TaxID=44577 RepID=A0A286AL58_9PROT|nr:hypothetical protein SAMN06297164_3534 [Nitrosomonas ureae]
MTEDPREINFWYTLKQDKGNALRSETVCIISNNQWIIYLVLAPILITLAFFSAFFFSIFFTLFLFGGITIGLWILWLRRKLRKSNRAQSLEGKYVV